MNFWRLNDELAVALTWLTRLPVQFPEQNSPSLGESGWAFPVVGAMLGAMAATVFVLVEWAGAPELLAGVLAVAALTLLTGGLHEDGLADFFDGLGARGGKTEKLAAMRDSRIGAYGVLALIISFAVRAAAISNTEMAFALIMVCAASRSAMVVAIRRMPQARTGGAAASAGTPSNVIERTALLVAFVIYLAWSVVQGFDLGLFLIFPIIWVSVLVGLMRKATTDFGGVTGDVLGAICLMSEAILLLFIAGWLA